MMIEFKAGKCTRDGSTVTPDTRKGLITVSRGEDELMHFVWKDRTTGAVEDDLIIFPDDTEFIKIRDRVFLLKFKISEQRLFFWSQDDANADKLAKRINAALNDTMMTEEDEEASAAEQMAEPASEPPMATSVEAQSEAIGETQGQGDLQRMLSLLSNIQMPQQQQQQQTSDVSFQSVLTLENIMPVLNDPECLKELYEYLPPGSEHSKAEVLETIQSPQYKQVLFDCLIAQSLRSLTAALRSGQALPLYEQLGLRHPTDCVGVIAFLRAILELSKNKMEM